MAARPPDPVGFVERVLVTLAGVRQPVVAILLLISFFTVISGKPLDGLLLLVVATALAWDAGMRARESASAPAQAGREPVWHDAGRPGLPGPSAWAAVPPGYRESGEAAHRPAWRPRDRRPSPRPIALGIAGAVTYSLTVGSFTRYSWPATAGVVGLGASVVVIGWGGPTRQREVPVRLSRTGFVAWGSLLVAGSLWELIALLGQPNFEQSSYAHPTISTLTDPLMSSSLGRSVALLGWIALGAFLAER